ARRGVFTGRPLRLHLAGKRRDRSRRRGRHRPHDAPARREHAHSSATDRHHHSSDSMIHTTTVALPPADVLARAQEFFAERVPHAAAFVEKAGPGFVTLRGQGGEEIAISAWDDRDTGVTRVRASTLFFDQALDRFFSTLPL